MDAHVIDHHSQQQVTFMNDGEKTKKQLMNELIELRQRNVELEQSAINPNHADLELKETQNFLNNIIESSLDCIEVADSTGKITRINKSLLNLLGLQKEEIIGKYAYDFKPNKEGTYESTTGERVEIDEEFLKDGKTMISRLFEEGQIKNRENYLLRKDGKVVAVEENIALLYNDRGEVTGSVAIIRDISERKRAITTLRKSEEMYHNLIELANAGIIAAENDKITQVNRKAEEIYGYSKEELIGRSPTILTPIENREKHRAVLNEILTTGNANETVFEEDGIRKDGSLLPIEISFSLALEKENMIIAVVKDISDRKRSEQERKRLLDELKEKNKELEQLVYIASHDLRSPLVNIQGFSRELEHAFKHVQSILFYSDDISQHTKELLNPALEEDIPEALQYILTSITKMDLLLSGLLRLSRLGRAALNIQSLDMNKLVFDIAKSFEYRVKEIGVTMEIDELPSCLGDEIQINQVFSNLLDNALKYLNPGQAGIIKISGRKENGHALFYVEDNGIGIASEHQEKIYEIFHRLNPSTTKGEGLGLTISRKIVDRHAGKMWVQSEPGKGSKFFVSLPTN